MEKYTIIIPVRDRAETLGGTIKTCLRQTYKNFEVIVSDNCSSDNTREVVERFDDSRIRYINPGKRLSMTGNFEFALRHVDEGFVMFIGSDDGVLPDAVQYVNSIVSKFDVDAVSCAQATYVWPNFPDEKIAGRLTLGGLRHDVEIRRSSVWIEKTLSYEAPYCFDLPNLYCGFVHKRIIDKGYRGGLYFHSITPDAYSAWASAIFIDKYAFSHKPFSIAGASAKSNGASAMNPAGNIAEVAKFYSENDIDFCEGFVNCPSYEVVLTEAFAKLSKVFPQLCEPYRIDYRLMLKRALTNSNQKTEKAVQEAVKEMATNFGVSLDAIERSGRWNKRRSDLLGTICRIFMGLLSPRAVAVDASALAMNDIDDAAVVAHALMESAAGKITTTRSLIKERVRQRIGFC